ncbi:hypothetical protein E4U43_005888 [Claviceps pusilla]|uniref:Uncharacterized protein n=1 Tax=Claviceps pusilla TaxID=123648 RepID=A0A9P7SYU8_9HYPO|nr:hypothetical protein E4U43_005888 [Claviceps pusilla]
MHIIQSPTSVTETIVSRFGSKEYQIVTASRSNWVLSEIEAFLSVMFSASSGTHKMVVVKMSMSQMHSVGDQDLQSSIITTGYTFGPITVVEYYLSTKRFGRVHLETFG